MKKTFFALLALLLIAAPARAELIAKDIKYKDGETELTGYYVYDDAFTAPLPGVIVIHEWWGHNDYARRRADQLAALGYAVFALDMYGTGKMGMDPAEATALSKPFYDDRKLMVSRAEAGLNTLLAQPQVDATRTGAVGYCFGGTVALEMARKGIDLKGVAAFHAGLSTPERAEPARVKAQVLVLNGGDDAMVKQEERDNFVAEMKAAGVTFKNVDYPGALHAFTNPKATEIGERFKIPVAYHADADKKSWAEMEAFFARLFKPKAPETTP
ncbi:MAG: dienelactone hydrolase family protein [Alphaproteobacteria bacterium]